MKINDNNIYNEESYIKRGERILSLSDKALEKVSGALNEIDRCIVKVKEKTKTVEYDSESKKPITENVCESEKIEIAEGMIDTSGLKQLVSTLKEIKDIHLSFADSTAIEEGETGVIEIAGVTKAGDDCI